MQLDLDTVYCGAIKRGDVFVVRNQDEETVVVVQDDILNERLPSVLVIPITEHRSGDPIFKNEFLLAKHETGLGKSGLCRPWQMQAVDRHHMLVKRGEIGVTRLQELLEVVDINLGRFRDL